MHMDTEDSVLKRRSIETVRASKHCGGNDHIRCAFVCAGSKTTCWNGLSIFRCGLTPASGKLMKDTSNARNLGTATLSTMTFTVISTAIDSCRRFPLGKVVDRHNMASMSRANELFKM